MSHLQFCKKWGRYLEMNRLYTRMLKIHSNNPGLWIMAAKFQLEENNSGENARALFLRSLRHHPKVQKLWTEYFRMELLHADKLRKRMSLLKQTMVEPEESELEDALMRGELARRVYSTAIKEIPDDIAFRLSFIPVVRCFDFTSQLVDAIYEDLERDHPDNDLTWKALARRHLVASGTEDEVWLSEVHCHSIFDQALEKVSGVGIWAHYADTCLERLELDGSDDLNSRRAEKTLAVFESAEKKNSPTEDMYKKWVEVLRVLDLDERALEVSLRSTEVHQRSLDLWIKRLILVITTGGKDGDEEDHRLKVRETFDLAISHVKSKNALDIWNIGLEWCLTNDTEMIQNLFECGLKEHRVIALPLKIRYLEWTALVKGMGKARKLYKRMATEKPLGEEFFDKYIALEEAQPTPKAKKISEAYDDALREFGETSPGLWLAYIRHEITHPEGSQGKAMQLHWKAMKTLEGEQVEQFVNGYTLMQTKDSGD
ncbi:U3 small nucleolar RNA-associated protein 6 homolog isoform X2 [Strongylocentrotus purpuratus]|nr:U3 small nucleolar RNA-associated protein 6 homolog isoform X2 [Strongylocentrotus purpuratus]